MTDRLRDMFWAPGGKAIGGINYVGVLAENLPASGEHFASLLRNDVSLPADNGKLVRMELLTHNIPGGATFWLNEDGSGYLLNCPSGAWGGTYRLWIDGIPSTADNYGLGAGIAPFSIVIGTPCTVTGDAPFVLAFGATGSILGWAVPSCEITGAATWLVNFSADGLVQGRVANTAAFQLPVARVAWAGRITPTKVLPLDLAQTDDIAFDFTRVLRQGEWLDAGTVRITAEVRYGGIDTAAALFVGEPGVLGGYVMQRLKAGLPGLTYLLRCTVRTATTGRELVCAAFLPVKRLL